MGKYDNFKFTKGIARAQKKLDRLMRKRKPDQFKIERARNELETAKLFESCQIFKSHSDAAPNLRAMFSDDNRVMLFCGMPIKYEDIASYRIIEKVTQKASTTTKQKGTITRAIVGGAIAGGIGAVVGAMSAGSTANTTYYESGNGFLFQINLKNGKGWNTFVENYGILSNKIHPKWLELGTKIQTIIDENENQA